MLKANGISSFADMAGTSLERFRELLKANNMSKFRNPTNWAAEAAAIANLPAPAPSQPTEEPKAPKQRGRKKAEAPAATVAEPKKRGPKPKAAAAEKPAKAKAQKSQAKINDLSAESAAPLNTGAPSNGSSDDLTKINGIGDKVLEVLRANGINTFADVAATSVERFREILVQNKMSRFRDPSPWPVKAAELLNKN